MLPQKHRLPVSQKTVFNNSISTPFFRVRIASSSGESKFGFIVSKRVDKRAVIRNAVRRKFSRSIQNLLPSMKGAHDMLFIVRASAKDKNSSEIEQYVKKVLEDCTIISK